MTPAELRSIDAQVAERVMGWTKCDVNTAIQNACAGMVSDQLTKPAVQRLEAWMREITDLICYQPEVPMAHKTCLLDALVAFQKEINSANPKPI